MAGFIKSINYDFNDSLWETERFNGRAPMYVKVSMEFAPIHDINPGLDSHGFNTAPLYNVGGTLKSLNKDSSTDAAETKFSQARSAVTNRRGRAGSGSGGAPGGGGPTGNIPGGLT